MLNSNNNLVGIGILPTFGGNNPQIPKAYLIAQFYNADNQPTQQKILYVTPNNQSWNTLGEIQEIALENGRVEIFVANESNTRVFFDDLSIYKSSTPIVQENHYYPFGMNLVGIEKEGTPNHRFQFMGKEKESSFGLNWTETDWRGYDGQVGRFWQVDKLTEYYFDETAYHYSNNNPINFTYPSGLATEDPKQGQSPTTGELSTNSTSSDDSKKSSSSASSGNNGAGLDNGKRGLNNGRNTSDNVLNGCADCDKNKNFGDNSFKENNGCALCKLVYKYILEPLGKMMFKTSAKKIVQKTAKELAEEALTQQIENVAEKYGFMMEQKGLFESQRADYDKNYQKMKNGTFSFSGGNEYQLVVTKLISKKGKIMYKIENGNHRIAAAMRYSVEHGGNGKYIDGLLQNAQINILDENLNETRYQNTIQNKHFKKFNAKFSKN